MSNEESALTDGRIIILARTADVNEAGTYHPIVRDRKGNLKVSLSDLSGNAFLLDTSNDDGEGTFAFRVPTQGFNYLFNGTGWDRERSNTQETILASAARTATVNSADFVNYNARGLHVIIDVTAITATPSIVPKIQGKDSVSGNYYDILEGSPITTTGTNILKVYPGISAVVNASAADILPREWRIRVEHADADSITYSVGAALVL